jgi:hypothetical protein
METREQCVRTGVRAPLPAETERVDHGTVFQRVDDSRVYSHGQQRPDQIGGVRDDGPEQRVPAGLADIERGSQRQQRCGVFASARDLIISGLEYAAA